LRAAFNEKTKAIIINTPHNPTGKVFTREELRLIADLCVEYDALALTDEIYEHIWYPDAAREIRHVSIATLDGMRDRTVTINSLSKTYSVTGWRVGYAIAAPDLINGIRQVHDFLTVGAAAPLQEAGVYALGLPAGYYENLQREYQKRRDYLLGVLEEAGFKCFKPDGAYYIMTDISDFGFEDDLKFTRHLVQNIGVAVVPGSSFYRRPELGAQQVRFCYCKRDETLEAAALRLQKLR
jgi:aspartate/methionine/tyrosine aminotransferase